MFSGQKPKSGAYNGFEAGGAVPRRWVPNGIAALYHPSQIHVKAEILRVRAVPTILSEISEVGRDSSFGYESRFLVLWRNFYGHSNDLCMSLLATTEKVTKNPV